MPCQSSEHPGNPHSRGPHLIQHGPARHVDRVEWLREARRRHPGILLPWARPITAANRVLRQGGSTPSSAFRGSAYCIAVVDLRSPC